MRTDISGLALAAAFFYAGVPASLAESASEGLYRNLSQDISSAAIPSGYKLFLVQPTARGDEDVHQKVEARVQAMLTREGLIVKKGEFGDEGWEGFTYFVFATPDAAARFHMAESDAFYELKIGPAIPVTERRSNWRPKRAAAR